MLCAITVSNIYLFIDKQKVFNKMHSCFGSGTASCAQKDAVDGCSAANSITAHIPSGKRFCSDVPLFVLAASCVGAVLK